MTETAAKINDVAASLGLSMTTEFVPWSKSRNAGEKQPSLNWKVTLHLKGKPFLTTDYMAGCGHCPAYKEWGNKTVDGKEAVLQECETGKVVVNSYTRSQWKSKPILPELADVLHSLASDAEAIDYATFEDWADSLGYETDSRAAEKTYRACLEIGLKLRAAIGEEGLKMLREAVQDY